LDRLDVIARLAVKRLRRKIGSAWRRSSYSHDARIEIDPAPTAMRWIHDVFGNCVAIARFSKEASELRFVSNIRLDHQPLNAPDFQMEDYAQIYPFAYSAEEMPDLKRTMERQYLDPDHQIHRWVQKFLHQGRPTRTGELLMTLTYAIKELHLQQAIRDRDPGSADDPDAQSGELS
jgi:hypothetical protein